MSLPLTKLEIEQVIKRVRPNHQSLMWFDGGDNREVVVVDEREAFRFPKEEAGIEVGRYEFKALELLEGKLSVSIPEPIELASDGSYNILSFLPGKVLSKQAVTELSFEKRRELGIAIAIVINDLNSKLSEDELREISAGRSLRRNRDDYYASIYHIASQQAGHYAAAYCENYELLQRLRPQGSRNNIIVFGDFSSPNIVLSNDDQLAGLVDWTELGLGDIHNELRPVFSVIGQVAFEEMVQVINPTLGPIDQDLVRLCAVVHELTVLVSGKQKGKLTPARTTLALNSLDQWLPKGWAGQ